MFSKTLDEHVYHLEKVIEKIVNVGMILYKRKIEWFKSNVNFLGVEIGEGEIQL